MAQINVMDATMYGDLKRAWKRRMRGKQCTRTMKKEKTKRPSFHLVVSVTVVCRETSVVLSMSS